MLRGEFAAVARRVALPLLGALLVHGCAVVTTPGFDYADPKTRTSVTLGQYVPADPDNPPQGVVTPITPTLVHAQYQNRPPRHRPKWPGCSPNPSPTPSAPATSSASWCTTTPSCCRWPAP